MLTSRLTETPDLIRLGKKAVADHLHATAWAFSVINNRLVAFTGRTHPFIFNALKIVADPEAATVSQQSTLARGGPAEVYDDFSVQFSPKKPGPEDLRWYKENRSQDMGENRRLTKSGRVWKAIKLENGDVVSAISFWEVQSSVGNKIIELIAQAFKLKGTIYVEFLDSKQPHPFVPGEETKPVATKELKSARHPHLTSAQIVDILVKGHVSPFDLTGIEKNVVDEFRGVPVHIPKLPPGVNSLAQLNAMRTVGESLGFTGAPVTERMGSYAVPQNPVQVYFDLHALYLLEASLQAGAREENPQNFRSEELVKEALHAVLTHVTQVMQQKVPLACVEEALHINQTKEFDLEAVWAGLVAAGVVDPANPRNLARAFPALVQYVHRVAPRLGNHADMMARLLFLALQHAEISPTGAVVYDPQLIPVQAFAAFLRTNKPGLDFLRKVFALTWQDGFGGPRWHQVAVLLGKLQSAQDLKTKVVAIDLIYDTERETGALLGRVPELFVPREALEQKTTLTSPQEYTNLVSDGCRRILGVVGRMLRREAPAPGETHPEPARRVKPDLQVWDLLELTTHDRLLDIRTQEQHRLPAGGSALLDIAARVHHLSPQDKVLFAVQTVDIHNVKRYLPVNSRLPLHARAIDSTSYQVVMPGMSCDGELFDTNLFTQL